MTTFDKFRNCITEPRCRDCEGIPGVCEEEHQSVSIPKALALDVLELLKEQEPLVPSVCGSKEPDGHGSWWYLCGKCKKPIDHKDRFCKRCGQAVKWE